MRRARGGITILLAAVLPIALVAVGCNREPAPEEAGNETAVEPAVEVTGVTLGRSIGTDYTITDETTTFRPGDTIYASVRTEGAAPNALLTARWTYQDGQVVDETSRSIAPDGPETTEFHISKPDGWPAGDYEVVILLDGGEVDRQAFRVEAEG
jgi:hypothetical protein